MSIFFVATDPPSGTSRDAITPLFPAQMIRNSSSASHSWKPSARTFSSLGNAASA
ncbi:hypothetical protein [Lysobacter gummosus]|uniref:hypothetical protein n=1 Tax=Lysobacter gummosus TaxID=262324 RepID=UPI003640DD7C